jgi:hypothetical protein
MIKLNDMKSIVNKIGAALLVMWAVVTVAIIVIGMGSDGPIDGPELINAWTFYGFILGVPTVAVAMMKWGGAKH